MIHHKNLGFWSEKYYGSFSKQAKNRQGQAELVTQGDEEELDNT